MGHRTREEPPDDDDDLLGDDLDGDPADDALDESLPSSRVDDELLDELDAWTEPTSGETLDEFVVDGGLVRDDGGTDVEDEAWPEDAHPDGLPALPWSTRAALPELRLDLAAVLDPTSAISEWVRPSPARRSVRAVVVVAGVAGEIELVAREGPDEQLRLGRDWLSGRAVVDPGGPSG